MICISVRPESRRLAKVDMLNAARQCDMIELCLDRLVKEPDMRDILDGIDKPVLVSCRRREHGGEFQGTEDERMTLLRQAIVANPAYVELELDVGLQVPRYGNTKRVISYNSMQKPLGNIDSVFQEAAKLNADVVKFTWPTPTLDAAWPLLAAVTKKRELPVVGIGLGQPGLTFSLLGRKYGSPWIYAALEKGMEGYVGQPTVGELDEIYHWREIDPKTQFVGVIGFGESEITTIRVFNAAFKQLEMNVRCLPLSVGDFGKLAKMLDILKIRSIICSRNLGDHVLPLAEHMDDVVKAGQFSDLLLKQSNGWNAHNTIVRSAIKALEAVLPAEDGSEYPLDRRSVMVIGHSGLAETMVEGISRRKGLPSISGRNEDRTRKIAQKFDVRFVQFSNIYDASADVVIFADPQLKTGSMSQQFNPWYLRPGMTVVDVGSMPQDSFLMKEARSRGCTIVDPKSIFSDLIKVQFKAVTGQELPEGPLSSVYSELSL